MLIFLLFCGGEAYGYLDPGTGSYIFQLLIAFFVGVVYTSKVLRRKVMSFIGSFFSRKKHADPTDSKKAEP